MLTSTAELITAEDIPWFRNTVTMMVYSPCIALGSFEKVDAVICEENI